MRAPGFCVLVLGLACRAAGSDDAGTAAAPPGTFGFGREATSEEITQLDTDVMPDGAGLPEGGGTVAEGRGVYERTCVACHGPSGTEGPYDVLVGRVPGDAFPFGEGTDAQTTIGSYWPYAPTVFDYIRRSMPFDAPGSLTDNEVYSVVGLLLHWNDLIPSDAVVNAELLASLAMPAADRFVMDDRTGGSTVR